LKIGIVCYPTYGGSGVVATELGRFLALRGHEVHFISWSVPFRLVHDPMDNVYFHEVQTIQYDLLPSELYGIALASKIVQVVEAHGLDIVHAHYAVPHAISGFMARSALGKRDMPFKVLTTLHGTDITLTGKAPSFFPIVKYAINESDGVTTVSNRLRDETIREFDIKRPIDVIPNFVDVDRFRKGLTPCKRGHFAPNGERILLHISNFRPVKRVCDVVEIFARVRKRIPSVLLMVGDGPDRDAAAARARSLGVMQHVKFLGKQENIELFMSCADAFVFPSEYESFGLAALEAMACELPVVASRAGGLPEVIVDGETGMLAEMGNVEEMAEKVLYILDDESRMKTMGAKARRYVRNHFLPNSIIPRYDAVDDRLLRGAASVRPRPNGEGGEETYSWADGI